MLTKKKARKRSVCRLVMRFVNFDAGWTGLEPATSAVTGQHSNQLNYQPVPREILKLCSIIIPFFGRQR